MVKESQPIIKEAKKTKKIEVVKSSEKRRKDGLDGVKNMITLELNGLKQEAMELEKKGEQEDYILNVLQPKIYALEKQLQELDGKEVVENKLANSEPVALVDKAKAQSLNEQQIKDLRESLMKAYVDNEQESTIKWLSGEQEEAGVINKKVQELKPKIQQEAVKLEQDSTLGWYEGKYDEAKENQDEAIRMKKTIGMEEKIPEVEKVKDEVPKVEAKTADPLVEKYGQKTIDEVRQIYKEEESRLRKMGLKGRTLETRLKEFKKLRLEPILNAENKQEVKNVKSPQDRTISMEIKPKESRFKKVWSSMKPSWWK